MMYFKEELLTKEIAVQCETEEQADVLLNWLHFKGKKWGDGESYLVSNRWYRNENNTCYEIQDGIYAHVDFYKESNVPIISFAEAIDLTKNQIVEPVVKGWFRDDYDDGWTFTELACIDHRSPHKYSSTTTAYHQFTPTDPTKKEEPKTVEMSHVDIFKAIREGALVRGLSGIKRNYWQSNFIIDSHKICYNYTGTDKDEWLQMKERK